jgi:hypothetical protein
MPGPRPRYDRYGRPLPRLADAPRSDLSGSETNVQQRERILRRLSATMDEQYPYLLRPDVSAEVTITFRVVRGTIQDELYVGIVRQYRQGEE